MPDLCSIAAVHKYVDSQGDRFHHLRKVPHCARESVEFTGETSVFIMVYGVLSEVVASNGSARDRPDQHSQSYVSESSSFQVLPPPKSLCKEFVSGTKTVPKTAVLDTTCNSEKRAPEMSTLAKATWIGIPINV